jgi:hypothetical protein
MRRMFFIVLLFIAVLGTCIVVLLFQPSLWPEVATRIGAATSETPRSADRASPFSKPEPKHTAAKQRTIRKPPDSDEEHEPAPPKAIPESVTYPFPIGTEITVGTSKRDVFAAFGSPEVAVTGADFGRLQERLIYIDRLTGKRTFISVVNGTVAGAGTYMAEEGR